MIEHTYAIVQSANVESGPPGTIRYTISLYRGGGMIEVTDVQSASAVDDGSGIDRKAAPVSSAWPALIVNQQLQVFIVELEASGECP